MKASLKALTFGLLLLLLPLTAAWAQGPSLSPIPNVSVNAGGALNLNVIAVDAEGRLINLTAALPPFVTLHTPTVGAGVVVTSLALAPSAAHVGDYSAAVTATAGGVSTVRVFQITVNPAGSDQAPVVTAPAWQEITAGTPLSFGVIAGDPDGDPIGSLTATDLPSGASFTPDAAHLNGMFEWTPGALDAGDYDVPFTAMNALSGTGVTHVRVLNPPTLTVTPIDDVTVAGGGFVSVPVHASGVPGALIQLTASLPSFAVLDPPGTGTNVVNTTVTVSPPVGSAGTYHASVTASSEGVNVTEEFDIIVTGDGPDDNHAPVLTAPATAMVAVGATLSFDVTASDPDGDHVDLFGSALPPGSDFTDHGDDTGTFSWTPVPGQSGTYLASFSGLDGRGGSGSAGTLITVTGDAPENHAPVLSAPVSQQVQAGAVLSFTVSASDPDGDHVTLSANALPFGATFTDHGDDTGTFMWTPEAGQVGAYQVAFLGFDGRGGTGTAGTSISVMEATTENHPPTVSAPAFAQVEVGAVLTFPVTASDPDGDDVALSAGVLPIGASFSDDGGSSGTFSWAPDATQPGPHEVTFHGDDGNGGTGTATTSILVLERQDQTDDATALARACIVGPFVPAKAQTCFRIRPVHHAFDLADVDLSGITLRFHDGTIAALDGAHIELDCRPGHGKPAGDDDDADGIGRCGLTCPDRGDPHEGDPPPGRPGGSCDTLGIRVCFATDALVRLFQGAGEHPPVWSPLPCALLDAEIVATLSNGATVVALFHGRDDGPDDDGNGDDIVDDGSDDSSDGTDDQANDGDHTSANDNSSAGDGDKDTSANGDDGDDNAAADPEQAFAARLAPNPVNPGTELSFTLPQDGRVSVVVYDMQGRVVKRLLDAFRPAGHLTLPWDGTDAWNLRVTSGVYFVRVQTPEGGITRRVTVLK